MRRGIRMVSMRMMVRMMKFVRMRMMMTTKMMIDENFGILKFMSSTNFMLM